ncbi:MAG: GIY-YIG nuclease family protein [Aeromicrobium erythreum]
MTSSVSHMQADELRADEIRKFNAALEGLSSTERTAFWNAKYSKYGSKADPISTTMICQLPKCRQDTVWLAGRSLGICAHHALLVVEWGMVVTTEAEQKILHERAEIQRIHRERKKKKSEAERRERQRSQPGWIYYVLIDGRIKIGYSVDVKRRLASYPFDSPLLAMHPGTKQTETEMHQKFAGSKAAGREWFLDTPELRAHIDDVIATFGEPDRARYERRGRQNSRLKARA